MDVGGGHDRSLEQAMGRSTQCSVVDGLLMLVTSVNIVVES